MIRIVLVHPKQSWLDEAKRVLAGESDLQVVAAVCTVEAARPVLDRQCCDLLLISAGFPGTETQTFLEQRMEQEKLLPPILVNDLLADQDHALFWMEIGAAGVIYDSDSWAEYAKKIRAAMDGEALLTPTLVTALMARIVELRQLTHELDASSFGKPQDALVDLTPREQEVLELLGENKSNQEIADLLVIELGTVKNHVHNILRKLDVQNRRQAAQVAEQLTYGERETA